MHFDVVPLELSKHPVLNAFLDADAKDPYILSRAAEQLIGSQPHLIYSYKLRSHDEVKPDKELRLHVAKNTISVFEICVALGKLEHLKIILSKTARSPVTLKNNEFYHDLMLEAVAYRQLDIIDFLLASHVYNFSKPYRVRHFLRLAIAHGYVDVIDKLIKFACAPILLNDLENTLLRCALECGDLPVVNQILKLPEINSTLSRDALKIIISAVLSSSLDIVKRVLEFENFKNLMNDLLYQDQVLFVAINIGNSDIFDVLYCLSPYIPIAHNDSKRDLLCLAALKGNDYVMQKLLINESVVQLARNRGVYRNFVGERLAKMAGDMGIDIRPQFVSPQSLLYVSERAATPAGQLGRFFSSELGFPRKEPSLTPEGMFDITP